MTTDKNRKEYMKEYKKIYYKKNKDKIKKYKEDNKDKIKDYTKKYNVKNKGKMSKIYKSIKDKEEFKARKRDYSRRYCYNISPKDYQNLISNQNNKCAICKQEFNPDKNKSKPHIDHNHDTGKVRGLLCHTCNTRLAVIENKEFLNTALKYLECL